MTAPAPRPGPDVAGRLAEGHAHDWTDWLRPAVIRDTVGVVIDRGVVIQRLTGTDQPVTPAWWRTCRTCPSEESAFPAAEVEARVQAAERAAEELEAAADEVREQHGTASLAAKWIDARAAALRGEGRG